MPIAVPLPRVIVYVEPMLVGPPVPNVPIPIISPERGINETVDYAFLGAWNFKKEIFNKEKKFIKNGGKFITHIPSPRIINT